MTEWGSGSGASEARPESDPMNGADLEPAHAPRAELEPPDGGASELRRLDTRWITLRRIAILAQTIFFSVAAFFAELLVGLPFPSGTIPIAVAVAGVALVLFWPPAEHRAWGYRVRGDDLFVRRGVLWRAASVIPHARIQHVDTQSGPLERALGLAQVVVYTAGIRGADVTIPGLPVGDAEALRDWLAELGGVHDGV